MSLWRTAVLKQVYSNATRRFSSNVENNQMEISPLFTNRNPRNLERMRIGYKPDGYHIEKPGKNFWHK